MGGSCKEHDCGNEGEEREDEEAEPVQHDGSVLPVVDCHSHLLGCADVLSYHSEIKNYKNFATDLCRVDGRCLILQRLYETHGILEILRNAK